MEIIVASKEQLPVIQKLAYLIWPNAYGEIISTAQIVYMLEMMYSMASLEKQMEEQRVFLLASQENRFVGFASYELNYEGSDTTKIHKLYVLPETQGKGVGKKLLDHIGEIALKNKNHALLLTVNKNNKAKDFYKKNGFEITEEAVFTIGNGYVMDDYIMEKKL